MKVSSRRHRALRPQLRRAGRARRLQRSPRNRLSLLSDPDSEIIESFGILNTLIPPDDHPWHGIPFPGTYVTNDEGVITHKFFEHSLAVRVGPEQLLAAVRGDVDQRPIGETSPEAVTVDVSIEGKDLPPGLQRHLVARFSVPAGQHLYGEPVADGMVAVTIEVDDTPGLLVSGPAPPATRTLSLSATASRSRSRRDGSPDPTSARPQPRVRPSR